MMWRAQEEQTQEVSRLLAGAANAIASARSCWLVTSTEIGAVHARPMGQLPRSLDGDEWTIRFVTDGRSRKAEEIRHGGRTTIIVQNADDTFINLTGPASLCEEAADVRRRWKKAFDAYFPTGQDRANAAFIAVDVKRMELWIRGLTPEPFGMRPTKLERDARGVWCLVS